MTARWKRIFAREWLLITTLVIGSLLVLVGISSHLDILKKQEDERRSLVRVTLLDEIEQEARVASSRGRNLLDEIEQEQLKPDSPYTPELSPSGYRDISAEFGTVPGASKQPPPLVQAMQVTPEAARAELRRRGIDPETGLTLAEIDAKLEQRMKPPPVTGFLIVTWSGIINCADDYGLAILLFPYLLVQFIRSQIWAVKTLRRRDIR